MNLKKKQTVYAKINNYYIFFLNIFTNCIAIENNHFLSLKNNKVNVRYGPGFDYPIKYIYKKKFLPVKIIDKKENFRKTIDHKKIVVGYIYLN